MIEILLSVYNGEKYLNQQIDSIINQTNQDWILKIRNDGSQDDSETIIADYCKRFSDKIIAFNEPKGNIGLVKSLNCLLSFEPYGDYVMFSDQDDVWLPKKIELTLNELYSVQKGQKNVPIMICTDAICVDANLNIINKSFFKSQKFQHGIVGDKIKMLALNQVQGCTIMLNKEARNRICPLPEFMKIHDMWVGVISAHYGISSFLPIPTMLYRQHNMNVLGEQKINLNYYLSRIKSFPYLIKSRIKLFRYLPFKVPIMKWLYYKIYYCLKRIL